MNTKANHRIAYFDILRAIAIIGVIIIHSNSSAYAEGRSGSDFFLNVVFRQTANFAVPLFLFISGYFLAQKPTHTTKEYVINIKKQIPRVVIPFIIWSLFYSIFAYMRGQSLMPILKNFLTFQASMPFYYILLIIQYYLLQPVIIWLAKNYNTLALSLIITLLLCIIKEYMRYSLNIDLPLLLSGGNFLSWLIFPVLGAFISIHNIPLTPYKFLITAIFFLILSICHSFYLIDTYHQIASALIAVKWTSFLYSISLILLLHSLKDKFIGNKILEDIGRLSFGMYFIHMFYLDMIFILLEKYMGHTYTSGIIWQLIIIFLVLMLSYLTGKLLRRLNQHVASKYIGF